MPLFRRLLPMLLTPPLLAACAATAPVLGGDKFLQLYVDDIVVFEYEVPGTGLPCSRNAWLNNQGANPKESGVYRCASEPASMDALPYSFVSFPKHGHIKGIEQPLSTKMRFATSAACHEEMETLAKRNRELVRSDCDGEGPPPPARPGETEASLRQAPAAG